MDDAQGRDPFDLLNAQECADLVGVPRAVWSMYVSRGLAPQPHQSQGRAPAWDRSAVATWQEAWRQRGVHRHVAA